MNDWKHKNSRESWRHGTCQIVWVGYCNLTHATSLYYIRTRGCVSHCGSQITNHGEHHLYISTCSAYGMGYAHSRGSVFGKGEASCCSNEINGEQVST